MKIEENKTPRIFSVGKDNSIKISDCGKIRLRPDELISFVTESGKRYDVTAKSWGFYATPSVNGRLKSEGFKTALVKNSEGRFYIMLVEKEKTGDFERYVKGEGQKIEKWLDELT